MSAICGFLGRPGEAAGPALASMLDALAPFGEEQARWTDGAVGLGWRAAAGEAVPTPAPRHDAGPALAVVADARLDDLAALCGALGVPPRDRARLLREGDGPSTRRGPPAKRPSHAARERTAPAECSGDAGLIRRAWLGWGQECPKRLLGDYAFAIWDVGRRMLFCARDHIGAKPLYYARTARGFAFASAVEGVLAAPGVSGELDEGRVVAYLTEIGSATAHRTFFKAVRKLPPGCSIVVTGSGDAASPQRHWRPEDAPEARPASDGAFAEEFLALYREAVRDRLRGAGPVGTHLSAGLDSSSVTVLAARELKRQGRPPPPAFSWLPDPGGKAPEAGHAREYALVEAVCRQEGLRVFHQSPGAADVLHLLRGDGARPGAGFHPNEYPVQRRAREQGVRVLLSGWGGDEGVSFNGRGHPAWLLFTGRWMRLLAECRARDRRLPGFLADVVLPLVHPRSKLVLRRLLRLRWGALRDRRWLVHPDLVRRAGPPPRRPAYPVVGMRRTQLLLLREGGLNERMEAWAASGARRGIEYRYPLLDRRLLEFALGLPPEQFRRGRWTRWLMRHAMSRTSPARRPRSCREHGEDPVRNAVLPSEVCWNTFKADPARSEPVAAAFDEAFLAVRAELRAAAEAPGRAACFDMPRLLERLDACRFRTARHPEVLYNALLLLDFCGTKPGWIASARPVWSAPPGGWAGGGARQVIRTMHDYIAWGLRVRSPFALPFTPLAPAARSGPPSSTSPDVTIRVGTISGSLATCDAGGHDAGVMTAGPTWQATRNAFLFNLDGVFRCLVVDGREIVVEPRRGDANLAGHLVGIPFAAVLVQRGALSFHASAIGTKAGAVLFAGRRGAGKSSLLAKLVERGYTMLSDDVVGVALDAGRPVALPAFPRLRLCADVLDRLRWRGRERGRICRESGKYEVPVERFQTGFLPVRAFCELRIDHRDDVEVEPAPADVAFRRMYARTYRKSLGFGAGQRPRQFDVLAAMAKGVPFAHVKRPAQPFLLDALADGIERWLSGLGDVPDPPAHASTFT